MTYMTEVWWIFFGDFHCYEFRNIQNAWTESLLLIKKVSISTNQIINFHLACLVTVSIIAWSPLNKRGTQTDRQVTKNASLSLLSLLDKKWYHSMDRSRVDSESEAIKKDGEIQHCSSSALLVCNKGPTRQKAKGPLLPVGIWFSLSPWSFFISLHLIQSLFVIDVILVQLAMLAKGYHKSHAQGFIRDTHFMALLNAEEPFLLLSSNNMNPGMIWHKTRC